MRVDVLLSLLPEFLLLGACALPPGDRAPAVGDLAGVIAPGPGAVPQGDPRRPRNYFDFMLGASYWDDLGGLDPTGVSPFPNAFGDFDRWGFAFDMGYDRVVSSHGRNDVTLGLELGWSTFENNGNGLASQYSSISSSMFYVAPVARLMMHLTPTVTLSPGIGAGYYGFSIDEYETYYYGWWWGYNARTLNQDSAFGGFLSLGVDFNLSPGSAFRIDNKVHFVDFGGLQSLMPAESSVGGPIWTLEVGFVLAF